MSDSQIPNENKGLLAEFIDFIVHNKAWWMTPIILVLILMVGFIIFLDSSPILPFISTVIYGRLDDFIAHTLGLHR